MKEDKKFKKWFTSNSFSHQDFTDLDKLVRLKEKKNLNISVALPTLNEEATIGTELSIIKRELMEKYELVDELAVIDSGSIDATIEIAKAFDVDVYLAHEHLISSKEYRGKGENLWKALYLLDGDIITFVDSDIKNFHSRFIYGIIGPLLESEDIGYVKAFYNRPRIIQDKVVKRRGGRVTEILARPLLNTFYPELSGVVTPLAGEYAGRREILEKIPFYVGYGVEVGLLIDIYIKFGLDTVAQVDLGTMMHKHKDLKGLGKMSFDILRSFLNRMREHDMIKCKTVLNDKISFLEKEANEYFFVEMETNQLQRPPMIEVEKYRKRFNK